MDKEGKRLQQLEKIENIIKRIAEERGGNILKNIEIMIL